MQHFMIMALIAFISPSVSAAKAKAIQGKQQSWSTQYSAFKGAIKSTKPVTVKSDDSGHNIIWSIGTQSPIDCSLQTEPVEPAQFILDWTGGTLADNGALPERKTVGLSAGQLHGFPYLSLFTEYTADGKKTLKAYVIDTIVGAVVCKHDEPGHEELVLSHLDFFMQHIEVPFNFNLRKSNRIFLVEIDSKAVGFEQHTTRRMPEGKGMDKRRASMLISQAPGQLTPIDKETTETLAFNGVLSAQRTYTRMSGQEQTYEVQSKDPENYTGSGVVNGKAVTIQFKVPSHSLMGIRTANFALAQKLKRDETSSPITLPIYNPYLNAQGPTNYVTLFNSKDSNGGYLLQESFGPITQQTTRDNKGLLLTTAMPFGAATLKTTRIYAKKYPRPKK